LKCDEKEPNPRPPFKPENRFVVVCEGFQDASFVCALLRHLQITNCDVTFPKKRRNGANGDSGIPDMVNLLSGEKLINGIAILRDADEDATESFKKACAAFVAPFHVPKDPFVIDRKKHHTTGVFLIPGNGKTGTIEHLLLPAVYANHPDLEKCINGLENCSAPLRQETWGQNKIAKMHMHCVVAAFCHDDPGCSLGWIWSKGKDNPLDIASPVFQELADFLRDFTAVPAMAVPAPATSA
jgi:hypothetical protein